MVLFPNEEMAVWLQLTICVVILLFVYFTRGYDYWEKKGVAHIKPLAFIGEFLNLVVFKRILREYGENIYRAGTGFPVFGYYVACTPILMVRDPELVRDVLVTKFDCFRDTLLKVNSHLDPLLARLLFVLKGDQWKAVRSLLTPAFTLPKIKNQFPLMALGCREMVRYLETEASKNRPGGLEVNGIMTRFTVDVVVRCGFGVVGNSFDDSEGVLKNEGKRFVNINRWNNVRAMIQVLCPNIPTIFQTRIVDFNGQDFLRQVIMELISYRERNRVFRNDYLQMLMHIKHMGHNENGKNIIRVRDVNIEFSDEDIVSHSVNQFFQGTELPSYILTVMLFELASNIDIQTRLRAEIDSVLRRYSGGLTYEAIHEMTYMDMVVNECLRRYPPFPNILRMCTKSCELILPDRDPLTMDEGTPVHISIEGIHLDPANFPEPHKFDPERFSPHRRASIKAHTFMPYGMGPRQCYAMKFADAEIKAGLVAIISHFEVRRTPKTVTKLPKLAYGFMAVVNELWLDFVRRT